MNETQLTVIPNERTLMIAEGSAKATYSLDKIPPAQSPLVINCKKEILHELRLEDVIVNLKNATGLMYVAYNALAGTQIQSKMSGLQKSLLDLCKDCIVTVQTFDTNSAEILTYLLQTYRWLFKGQEALAFKQLEYCGKCAGDMAKQSEELANRFDVMADKTEKVLEESQNEENLQYQKKEESKAKLRQLEAEQAAKQTLQQELMNDIDKMQMLYNEAKEREQVESERSFMLGITSALTDAIGKGVGAAMSMSNPVGQVSSVMSALTPRASQSSDNKETEEAKAKKAKEVKAAEEEVEQLEKAVNDKTTTANTLEQEVQKLSQALAKAEQEAAAIAQEVETKTKEDEAANATEAAKAKAKEALKTLQLKAAKADEAVSTQKKQVQAKTDELKALRKDIEKAEEKAKTKQAVLASLSQAFSSLSAGTAKMQESATSYAESARSEKMEYLNKKLEMEKQNREALSALAEYAKLVKNMDIVTNTAAAAVETLHVAVRCLKQIVTSLTTASLFWRSMEQYCKNLAKSKLVEQINDLQALPKEVRMEEYLDPAFMYTAVSYMARWVALNVVCKEYLQAVTEAYDKVAKNINSAPTIEEAKKIAPKLAEEILDSVNTQMDAITINTEALTKEKVAMEQIELTVH